MLISHESFLHEKKKRKLRQLALLPNCIGSTDTRLYRTSNPERIIKIKQIKGLHYSTLIRKHLEASWNITSCYS